MSAEISSDSHLLAEGTRVRREVLGAPYVDHATAPDDDLTLAFQPFMTSYCWGEIWTDETLPRRERSLLVLAMTAALGRTAELEAHTLGALRNGVTETELLAVLKQITVYCGVPAGVTALRAMREVVAAYDGTSTHEQGL
ncbi:carboxymuconolactone decarboxylase family protein [Mycolicibacterium sp. BiH015]|uniref:carboxymuconolactone decarboxylase family protein n=1 Tax=Mycolicibacterium sp. BiH015 TaxID=3018808 RepID=UPI0022E01EB5|nr:carboxymuconolactone decarboxylase family protein [Mycolicibacterium sp. BiH015]MDA2893313.1 carboxymuconolactone decarboxylase family protein [Mycolicibacterium sp. BiH015]